MHEIYLTPDFKPKRLRAYTVVEKVENSSYQGGPKYPPTWWIFYTITKWVEKFHHAVSTSYGGTLPPSARRWNNSTLSWQAFVNCSAFWKYC